MGNGPDVEELRKKATTELDPKLRAANQKKLKMFERLSIRQYLQRLAERGKVQKDPELREAYRRRLAMSDEEVAAMEERIKQ